MKINIKDFTGIKNSIDTAYSDILRTNNNDPRLGRASARLVQALDYMGVSENDRDVAVGEVRKYTEYAVEDLDNYLEEFDTDTEVDGIASDLRDLLEIIDNLRRATP